MINFRLKIHIFLLLFVSDEKEEKKSCKALQKITLNK